MSELKRKAIKGVTWSIIDKICVKFISFVIGVIIARVLTPADYGIIGMIMVFIVIANLLVDSGISQALIQQKKCTQTDRSTAFIFNIAMSLLCYALLFIMAVPIAKFYDMPLLAEVLRVLGLSVIIMSFATVQRANLQSELNFRLIALVNISGVIFSGGIGIIMAYNGYGVWSIVFQQLASYTITTTVYWLLGNWHPTMIFSSDSLKRLWRFGSKLLAAGVLATLLREIYTVTIGKIYNASELGYYSRAVQTTDMVAITTNEMINAVTFPILSSLQDDKDKMVSVYSRMLGMTAFFIFPIMTLLAVLAEPLILVLLTDKWAPAIALIQWLCFARIFTPISSLNMNILNAVGRSDLFLKLDMSKIPLCFIAMIITIPLGVKAIVIGNFITSFISYFINAYLPGKLFGFGIKAQLGLFKKILISTLIMAIATLAVKELFTSILIKLIVCIIVGIITYVISNKILKSIEYQEVKDIVSTLITRTKIIKQ